VCKLIFEGKNMYKITNIETLGTDYTVANQDGKIIKHVQIIPHTEILNAALGPYTDAFDSIEAYLEKSVSVLEGNEDIDPNRVYWYATEDNDVPIGDVIEYAVKHGYDIIIMEHIDPMAI
jgi:hypothetical protein